MGTLKEYKDFNQKEYYANVIKIESKEHFDLFFENIEHTTDAYWRGVNESKHMTYSSAQRMWIKEDLPHENSIYEAYIKHIYQYVSNWNNECISKVLNKNLTVTSALSILQHNGCPTPLIDITKNQFVGLFFASYYSKTYHSNNQIDNYFSLYEIKNTHPIIENNIKLTASNWFSKEEKRLRTEYKNDKENFRTEIISELLCHPNNFFVTYSNPSFHFINDNINDEVLFDINNNYQIINQEGLFILNITPIKTLEESIFDFNFTPDEFKRAKEKHLQNFTSYDIHKKLKEYCIDKLSKKGITEEFIFPKIEKLATDPLKSFLLSDLNK